MSSSRKNSPDSRSCIYIVVDEKIEDTKYVLDKIGKLGYPLIVSDPREILDSDDKESISMSGKCVGEHDIVFHVTLGLGFDRATFDAVLFDSNTIDVCRDLLENVGFDVVCHEVVSNDDALRSCAYAATREAISGRVESPRVFLKPVQRGPSQRLLDLKGRISSHDPALDKVQSNGVDPRGVEISVVVPVFNGEDYITECLESVAASRCDTRFELIIVNDASTDSTGALCTEFIHKVQFPARVITKHTNCHLAHARNTGIAAAVGEHVFLLDSDNLIGEDCLRIHHDAMVSTGAAVCYAPVRRFHVVDGVRHDLHDMSAAPFDVDRMLEANYIDAMAMVRRSDIIGAGGFATWLLHFGIGFEDYEMWLRLHSMGKVLHFIGGEHLSSYRVHGSNMTDECASGGRVAYEIVMNIYRRLLCPSS